MKIAFAIERMDTSRGGRETSTLQVAKELVARGCEVTVLCQSGSSEIPGPRVQPLGVRGWGRVSQLRNFAADVARAASEGKFDVLHAVFPVPGADVYQPRGGTIPAQLVASLRRRESLSRIAAMVAQPFRFRQLEMARMERELVERGNAVCVCVSQMVAQEFRKYYRRTEGVRVVFNGVDVPDGNSFHRSQWRADIRNQINAAPTDPVFITVATNFKLKGVSELIAAFAEATGKKALKSDLANAKLIVVGGKPEGGSASHLVRRLSVTGRVHFVGPTHDIFPYYAAADVCALLSWYDPCSRVVLEATRWGIPSITTIFNGAAEVLSPSGGIVVDSPRNTPAIVAAMKELADPAGRMGREEACLNMAKELSIDRHVNELMSIYTEIVERKR